MSEELTTSATLSFTPEPSQRKARLTVVERVYHSLPGESPDGPESVRFFRWLESDEKAYARTITVGEEWVPLDMGWLEGKGCSLLVMENTTKRLPSKRPTQEEIDEMKGRVIEFGINESRPGNGVETIGYFPPEEGVRFSPTNIKRIRVRCRKGTAKLSYYLVPT